MRGSRRAGDGRARGDQRDLAPASRILVTHRRVTHEVVIVSGHVAPDHPDSLTDWSALARLRGTIVLMMGVERLDAFATVLWRADGIRRPRSR